MLKNVYNAAINRKEIIVKKVINLLTTCEKTTRMMISGSPISTHFASWIQKPHSTQRESNIIIFKICKGSKN